MVLVPTYRHLFRAYPVSFRVIKAILDQTVNCISTLKKKNPSIFLSIDKVKEATGCRPRYTGQEAFDIFLRAAGKG
jgi:hypothetical protein